jgi:fumarate hydratase class II
LNMAMYHIIGLDTAVALASQAGQLELNVMMPIIAHDLFEMMHVMIGAISAFTDKCVVGIKANRAKAEGWLARNTIVVTALNPIIGYLAGAALVKEALSRDLTVQEVALEKVREGALKHKDTGQPLSEEEIRAVFSDMRKLTEGGLFGGGGGGG